MVLQDIMDQYDLEENFEYAFSMYCNFLEREGKWNLCENNITKNNFRCRMRKVHKGDLAKSKEYKKFEIFIEKRKVREQKEVEMRAIKIQRENEEKDKELIASLRLQLIEKDKIIEQKDKEIKEEFDKRMLLMDKYDSDSD